MILSSSTKLSETRTLPTYTHSWREEKKEHSLNHSLKLVFIFMSKSDKTGGDTGQSPSRT